MKKTRVPKPIRNRIRELRMVRAGELLRNPKNWRKHSAAQRSALAALMKEIGFADALLARECDDGQLILIDGHLRLEESNANDLLPVLVLDLNEAEADKLLATLDPLAAMADIDAEKLEALLAEVDTSSESLQAMLDDLAREAGIGEAEELIEDVAPEPPTAPISKAGDLWLLGHHRLLCGDSTDAKSVERLFGGRQPKLMVTDQPYGVEYDAEWRNKAGLNKSSQTGKVLNDNRASWAATYRLFPGDVAYVWHAGRFASDCERSLKVLGFDIRAQIIWMKTRFAISRGQYHWRHEPCWYAVRKGGDSQWTGGRKQSTVWADIVDHLPQNDLFAFKVDDDTVMAIDGSATTVWEIPHDKACGGGHSTQKPVLCMARPMTNHGGPGDEVYEPFAGSGTTVIAAEQLGRLCYAVELNEAYCDVIVERWQNLTGEKAKRHAA